LKPDIQSWPKNKNKLYDTDMIKVRTPYAGEKLSGKTCVLKWQNSGVMWIYSTATIPSGHKFHLTNMEHCKFKFSWVGQ